MSKKNKLQKFEENRSFDNLFQYSYERIMEEGFPLQGKWHSDFFRNDNPIVLELGCGKGEYTVGLARAHRDINYIGVDIKGARMWRGLTQAREEGLTNVAFIRTRIDQIEHFFAPDEVSEIWVTFPDPHPGEGERNARHRLTSPEFLERYRKIVRPDGILNLKTDSPIMYEFTLHEVIEKQGLPLLYATDDLYANDDDLEVKTIRTFYEQMWLDQGLTIKYLRFKIKDKR
jgi:tRNA (guanine-N7-)-methyltransferase